MQPVSFFMSEVPIAYFIEKKFICHIGK